MSFQFDTLHITHQLTTGIGYPDFLGYDKDVIRGSVYLDGPAVIGDENSFRNVEGSLMVGPCNNEDAPIPLLCDASEVFQPKWFVLYYTQYQEGNIYYGTKNAEPYSLVVRSGTHTVRNVACETTGYKEADVVQIESRGAAFFDGDVDIRGRSRVSEEFSVGGPADFYGKTVFFERVLYGEPTWHGKGIVSSSLMICPITGPGPCGELPVPYKKGTLEDPTLPPYTDAEFSDTPAEEYSAKTIAVFSKLSDPECEGGNCDLKPGALFGLSIGASELLGVNLNVSDQATFEEGPVFIGSTVSIASTATYNLQVVNGIYASGEITSGIHTLSVKKDFDIPHPTREGWRLTHACVEGPEAAVYVRGRVKNQTEIHLPEYWTKLVDESSITVSLTPIGSHQDVIVKRIGDNKVYLQSKGGMPIDCFYHIFGERLDTEKLIPEYKGTIEDYPGDNSQRSIVGYHYDTK